MDAPASPWVELVRVILSQRYPQHHPALVLLWLAGQAVQCGGPHPPEYPLPAPLRRMVAALRAMGLPQDMCVQPARPGPWCAVAPLWGNPFLRLEAPPAARLGQALWRAAVPVAGHARAPPPPQAAGPHWAERWAVDGFAEAAVLPRLVDLASLRDLMQRLRNPADRLRPSWIGAHDQYMEALWGGAVVRAAVGTVAWAQDPTEVDVVTRQLWQAVPAAWRGALTLAQPLHPQPGVGAPPLPSQQLVVHHLLSRLGWPATDQRGLPVARGRPGSEPLLLLGCEHLTVKSATTYLLRGVATEHTARHLAFAQHALSQPWLLAAAALPPPLPWAGDAQEGLTWLQGRFQSLWGLRWHNTNKDAFWRLAVNGVAGALATASVLVAGQGRRPLRR